MTDGPDEYDQLLRELLAVCCGCRHKDFHDVECRFDPVTGAPQWLLGRCGACQCPGGMEGWPWVQTPAERRARLLAGQLALVRFEL